MVTKVNTDIFIRRKILLQLALQKFGPKFLIFYMNFQTLKQFPFKINKLSDFSLDAINTWCRFKKGYHKKPKSFAEI